LRTTTAYQAKDDLALGIGDSLSVIPVSNKPALDFLDTYIAR
jgi:hypothetical protein